MLVSLLLSAGLSNFRPLQLSLTFSTTSPLSIIKSYPHSVTDVVCDYRYASSDRLLQTLGILLIELCFGAALETHEMRRQYQSSTNQGAANADLAAALDLAVALEWSQSVGGEAGESYADAVQWCLRAQSLGPKDDKWREDLFANVVTPLQYCYEQLSSRSM